MIRSEQIAKLKEELALHEQTEAAYAAWQKDNSVPLQYQWSHEGHRGWRTMDKPTEGWTPLESCHYRIKPTPRLRPWTAEEGIGKVIRHTKSGALMVVTYHWEGTFHTGIGEYCPVGILDNFTQLDGSPCGVQE